MVVCRHFFPSSTRYASRNFRSSASTRLLAHLFLARFKTSLTNNVTWELWKVLACRPRMPRSGYGWNSPLHTWKRLQVLSGNAMRPLKVSSLLYSITWTSFANARRILEHCEQTYWSLHLRSNGATQSLLHKLASSLLPSLIVTMSVRTTTEPWKKTERFWPKWVTCSLRTLPSSRVVEYWRRVPIDSTLFPQLH